MVRGRDGTLHVNIWLFQASLVIRSKELTCQNAGDLGLIPGSGRFPWRRAWQPTPVFLPGESHGRRSLEGYSLWNRRVRTDLATKQRSHWPSTKCWKRPFLHWLVLASLAKINCPQKWKFTSRPSILFYWRLCPSTSQNDTFLITTVW